MTAAATYQIGDVVDFMDLPGEQPSVPSAPQAWYLVRVHPLRERRVAERLLDRGLCCYAPTFEHQVKVHRHWRQWSLPKTRRRRDPLFPGVVLVPDFDADVPLLKYFSSDVVGLLVLGEDPRTLRKLPARLSAPMFRTVRRLEKTMGLPLSQAKRMMLQPGDPVRIREGAGNALEMWVGRFDRLDGKGRLRVLIDAMSREVPVVVNEDQVEPV